MFDMFNIVKLRALKTANAHLEAELQNVREDLGDCLYALDQCKKTIHRKNDKIRGLYKILNKRQRSKPKRKEARNKNWRNHC